MNRKSEEIKEKQISEVMASIENRVRHAYNQGYEQGLKASRQEPCEEITREEAIKMLYGMKADNLNLADLYTKNKYDALKMAINALEQEPKQVELEGDGYADGELVYDYGKCPSCGWQYEDGDKDWEEPYCCHCGQKLQWFEESEGINETE